MKKIAALLVLAALFATNAFAQASVGGWLETTGVVSAPLEGGDAELDDEGKKAVSTLGITTLGLTFAYYGDGFGATADLGSWTGGGSTLTAPAYENVWIYSDIMPGMFTVYGTVHNLPIKYTPSAAVEGGQVIDYAHDGSWVGKPFDDGFGIGLGAYNYQANGNGYTGGVQGIAGEFKIAGLSAALVANFGDAEQFEDTEGTINVKYDAGIVTAFAGYAMDETPALWVAASTNIMEGLMADVKYEGILGEDEGESRHVISANLGYSLEMLSIASELNYSMTDVDLADGAYSANDYFQVGAKIAPSVPMVGLAVNSFYKTYTQNDTDYLYDLLHVGLEVSKSVGNVGNTLYVGYTTHEWDELASFGASYAINIWF